ncbi:MAG: hypothetical protein J6T70_15725 [Bacteroidales bacterium]|nr:hypothetical protein [Bacteroidales bacterium]
MLSTRSTIQEIDSVFPTGDLPVLVTCDDQKQYICKYMRADSVSAYKLASELLGSLLAQHWGLNTPEIVFVKIQPEHTKRCAIQCNHNAEAIGYLKIDNAADVTNCINNDIKKSDNLFNQLIQIALFDFWVANEDRTCNNANMLYVDRDEKLISIDYGGIFNTNSFDTSLYQLSPYDSIIYADIFSRLKNDSKNMSIIDNAKKTYDICIKNCRDVLTNIDTMMIPQIWNVSKETLRNKINELFDKQWINCCFDNFKETLQHNL